MPLTTGYRLFLFLYRLLMGLVSPFHRKASQWIEGRRGLIGRMEEKLSAPGPRVWFHCASVGEFEQARPLIEAFRERYPQYVIILTFFSPSGYELRKNYSGADYVFYLPFDRPSNARDLVRILKPAMVFFVKYEFWHFTLEALHRAAIPVYLVSGIFRPSQRFFAWYGWLSRRTLQAFSHFFVQDQGSLNLLKSIGFQNASLAGDTRFDRVLSIAAQARSLPIIESFAGLQPLLVAGSSWPPDEDCLFEFMATAEPSVKLIIAPHEVHPDHLARLKRFEHWPLVRYTLTNPEEAAKARILVLDTIGLLSSVYRYAHVAFVGGAFRTGLHNVLEPAVFGIPVLFGPNYSRFREASMLIQAGGAFSLSSPSAFRAKTDQLFADERQRKQAGQAAGEFVHFGAGAGKHIMDFIQAAHFQ